MEKIIAVVVSYNRQQLLSECISALRNQTRKLDAILVVNNGSTDNTESWLKQQNDIISITQNNSGSAGGFNTGIKWAYENGYSWIWCMDDDGYSKENALEKLLTAEDGTLRLMNCAVLDKDNKSTFVWNTKKYSDHKEVKEDIIHGIGHPFNGTLINRKIVERVGLPKAELFLWGDETEYYYRIINKNKIPVCTVTQSIHYHPSTRFSIKQDWDHATSWKMYYYVRNRFPVLQGKFNSKWISLFNYCCFIIAFIAVILVFQKTDKIKKIRFMIWPVKDAFLGRYDVKPDVVLKKLKNNSPNKKSTDSKFLHSRFSSHISRIINSYSHNTIKT